MLNLQHEKRFTEVIKIFILNNNGNVNDLTMHLFYLTESAPVKKTWKGLYTKLNEGLKTTFCLFLNDNMTVYFLIFLENIYLNLPIPPPPQSAKIHPI